jgi:hypothetical protein
VAKRGQARYIQESRPIALYPLILIKAETCALQELLDAAIEIGEARDDIR